LEIALDKYKNINDIYDYLMFISINKTDEFTLVAPKYKIDTTDLPYAIKDLEQKQKVLKDFIKDIKTVMARLESYDQLVIAGYYKTSKNIRALNRRMRNTSFAQI
jgi:TRAP-type C4-dicarboxylate transport system substrate-binding protein